MDEREREGFPRNNASSIGTITTSMELPRFTPTAESFEPRYSYFTIVNTFTLIIDDPFRAEELSNLTGSWHL